MTFSKRQGLVPTSKALQIANIDLDLRNSLWSVLKINVINNLLGLSYPHREAFRALTKVLWLDFYKKPIDTLPEYDFQSEAFIRENFFKSSWNEVYDFIEFILSIEQVDIPIKKDRFKDSCNSMLERENSGFRIVGNEIAPITNKSEIKEIEDSITITSQHSALTGANLHLHHALNRISDKPTPDYRTSIKESISAVESVARSISKTSSLAGALDKIKAKTHIHPALEQGFKKIYSYTSDADGIRHALMDEPNCDFEDAKFMLVSCSAFINYLIGKANKYGVPLDGSKP